MRELDKGIAEWRKRMAAGGVKRSAVLDELESHLREEIRARMAAGASEDDAFKLAAVRMGDPASVRREFGKIKITRNLPLIIGSALWIGLAVYVVIVNVWADSTGRLNLPTSIHIFAVTMGYAATLLAGFVGVCYICQQWLGRMDGERRQSLRRAVSRFVSIAALLVPVGFIFGTFWTKDHFGTYWIGSAREIWAVCVIGWFAGLWVLQRFTRVSSSILMMLCVIGSMIVNVAWFDPRLRGVLEMLRGQAIHWCLATFLGLQFLVLLMGLPSLFSANRFSWRAANS